MWTLSREPALLAIRAYNAGNYRGQRNVDLDRRGYALLAEAVPECLEALIDAIRFFGEDYGGTQARFLPAGFLEESHRIADALWPSANEYRALLRSQPDLRTAVPDLRTIEVLIAPFRASKTWIVWATKFLHFAAPRTFPILDSRAERALGLTRGSSASRYYHRYCEAIRAALLANAETLTFLVSSDPEQCTELKVLDKVLFEIGAPTQTVRPMSEPDPVVPASPPAAPRSPAVGEIAAKITNIASHAERARSGDRLELCVAKQHARWFPPDAGWVELTVRGVTWRVQIGNREGVSHIYFRTTCIAPDQSERKMTELLQGAGLRAGDKPILRVLGARRFDLLGTAVAD